MKEEEALVRVVRVVRGSRKSEGVAVGILTAKAFLALLSSFAPFALFAVQEFQTECPL